MVAPAPLVIESSPFLQPGRHPPERVICPIDHPCLVECSRAAREWITSRIEQGDPGPLIIDHGEMWTEQSLAEEDSSRRQKV